jgi:cysteine synthase
MLGAKVVLTPRAQKGLGMYQKAVELAETHGWFLARQFETEANADIHESTTAREIINDFAGQRLDVFVTGYGTGGTVTGVARVLRRERPKTRVVLCEPANAQLVGSGVAQQRATGGAPASSHPAWESHPIQGWTPDFIPAVLQEAIDRRFYDEIVPVDGAEGMLWTRQLAQKEGIFTGISGGSTFAVARRIAEREPAGSVILCILPDTGERYLSTPLFDSIAADMNEEELALSRQLRRRPRGVRRLAHRPSLRGRAFLQGLRLLGDVGLASPQSQAAANRQLGVERDSASSSSFMSAAMESNSGVLR